MAALLAGSLSACAPEPGPAASTPGPSSANEQSAEPVEQPVFHPKGTAEENLPIFTATLAEYAKGSGAVEGRPIVDAVAGAGFKKKRMQVSLDRTKTNLVADSIFVSVRIGKDCLIGQVLTEKRRVYTEVAPAVGPGGKLCLIGKTRPIDW